MEFKSQYTAKLPDENGYIDYTPEENETWSILYNRMMTVVDDYACDEFLQGLKKLDLHSDRIPQMIEVSQKLQALTGWTVEPVAALIPLERFFQLLANKQFPAASFIRRREELDYLMEPDMFHEIFGHCPLLTDQRFADFTERYGKLALSLDEKDALLMQRLYWFTVEFGLIDTPSGLRNYGGGILSSFSETQYAIDSDVPHRHKIEDGAQVLRTPYRIDMKQVNYFVINDFDHLYSLLDDPKAIIEKAHALGEFEAQFPVDPENPNIHIYIC
jgi:phenylalanine-4-hydroxylase